MNIEQQAKTFGANHWKINGQYVDFYNGSVFVGSSNLKYLN